MRNILPVGTEPIDIRHDIQAVGKYMYGMLLCIPNSVFDETYSEQ